MMNLFWWLWINNLFNNPLQPAFIVQGQFQQNVQNTFMLLLINNSGSHTPLFDHPLVDLFNVHDGCVLQHGDDRVACSQRVPCKRIRLIFSVIVAIKCSDLFNQRQSDVLHAHNPSHNGPVFRVLKGCHPTANAAVAMTVDKVNHVRNQFNGAVAVRILQKPTEDCVLL